MNNKLKSILDRLAAITISPPLPKLGSSPNTQSSLARPPMKLDIPRFDGQDPLGWIFKISQFFDY
ncbi:hypothetical protein HKD37_09G025078 [Glycine soja]